MYGFIENGIKHYLSDDKKEAERMAPGKFIQKIPGLTPMMKLSNPKSVVPVNQQ